MFRGSLIGRLGGAARGGERGVDGLGVGFGDAGKMEAGRCSGPAGVFL
jgi:hypothetical protein